MEPLHINVPTPSPAASRWATWIVTSRQAFVAMDDDVVARREGLAQAHQDASQVVLQSGREGEAQRRHGRNLHVCGNRQTAARMAPSI